MTTPARTIDGGCSAGPTGRVMRSAAAAADRYAPPVLPGPIDLALDANEGPGLGIDVAELVRGESARRYPSAAKLAEAIGARLGVDASRVLVTAGGDEAIDRACRAFLGGAVGGREIILPVPTFEMIGRYARLAGAEVVGVPWPTGRYPVAAVVARVSERTGMIAVVSPNNPTGAVACAEDLVRLAAAAPGALLLVDLAYAEFADEDLTAAALAIPNAVVVRTFSKAYGLAGLRVGYAVGSAAVIGAMGAAGSPYPVSGLSLAIAAAALRIGDERLPGVVRRVREERAALTVLLREIGAQPLESQGNFVLAEFADAERVWRGLGGLGIGVRRFAEGSGLANSLRITCPGEAVGFARLCDGLRAVMRPEVL